MASNRKRVENYLLLIWRQLQTLSVHFCYFIVDCFNSTAVPYLYAYCCISINYNTRVRRSTSHNYMGLCSGYFINIPVTCYIPIAANGTGPGGYFQYYVGKSRIGTVGSVCCNQAVRSWKYGRWVWCISCGGKAGSVKE